MKLPLGTRSGLFLLTCLFSASTLSALSTQISCSVQEPPTDPASLAFRQGDYSKAAELYSAAAKSNPKDMQAIAGQVRSLLEQQQVSAASDLAESSAAAHATSAVLATVLGEVRFRQGRLADAVHAYQTSLKLDPCLARTRYDTSKFLWVESLHASAYAELQTAHQLEPKDPDIHLAWIARLPPEAREKEIEGYLADSHNMSTDTQKSLKEDAERLRAILAAKNRGGCQLASASVTPTTLPFQYLNKDEANNYHGLGFDVKVNNKATARLQLDTGASGILLNRSTAAKAGLVRLVSDTISGIGDEKSMTGYWAYAEDLRIGTLEFKNCLVEVSDRRSIVDIDGLIGADVFENYYVQLDFPLRQMTLSSLPARPGNNATNEASLDTSGIGTASMESSNKADKASGTTAHPASVHYTDRYIAPEMQTWSPFARFGHQILINGQLKDGKPRLFLVDSGSSVTILSVPAAKSVGKVHSDSTNSLTGLNGKVKQIYTAGHIDVMFANLRDPLSNVFVMNLDDLSKGDGIEISGILGLQTLAVLTVDIDYRDGLIHLSFDPMHGANRW